MHHSLFSILYIFLSIIYESPLGAQSTVRLIDTNKKISTLGCDDFGHIIYGTKDGEMGSYDGLTFEKWTNLNASINKIRMRNGGYDILTNKGLYHMTDRIPKLISGNHLDVIETNLDATILVSSTGVFSKVENDYTPLQGVFYDINQVSDALFFDLEGSQYLRLNNKIFANRKDTWIESLLLNDHDASVHTATDKSIIIGDKKGIITYHSDGHIDSLYTSNHNVENIKLLDFVDGHAYWVQDGSCYRMSKSDSIPSYIGNIERSDRTSCVVDHWSNMWLTDSNYLYKITNISRKSIDDRPRLKWQSIFVNGNPTFIPSTRLKLQGLENEVMVKYKGLHLGRPHDLYYQTRIAAGNEDKWSVPTMKTDMEIRKLPPGDYEFQVRATIDGENFTYAPAIRIKVENDNLSTIWLLSLLGALLIIGLALYFNNRYQKLKAKMVEERSKLIQENKVLNLQQKALQLQMNPHFVFNALNSIQGLIASEENSKARKYLFEFSALMRSVLNQSRTDTIQLSEEADYLSNYLSLEKMANNDSFDYEIHIENTLEEDVQIPSMILQPFVENAIIHGIKSIDNGKINIEIKDMDTYIQCIITDNGVGRESAKTNKKSTHQSLALDIVRDRLKSKIKGIESITYKDLTDDNGKACGTQVIINIPVI